MRNYVDDITIYLLISLRVFNGRISYTCLCSFVLSRSSKRTKTLLELN